MNHTIQSRLEAQIDRTPDAVAVVCGDESVTYRELDERSNRLANHLCASGIGPEALVALCLPRTIDLIIAIAAIVKTGAAYVPLDPEHPKDRLAFYVSDSGAKVLLTDSSLAVLVPDETLIVRVDVDRAAIAARPSTRLGLRSQPDDLAYVIYTSGSTGVPKGVMVTNHNVVRLFDSTDHWYGFCERDTWAMFHSFAFDVSVWEIWGALLYGCRLVVLSYAQSRTPSEVAQILCDHRVTALSQTPSAFRQVGRAIQESGLQQHLRCIVFAGEALDFTSLRSWVARYGVEQPQLINMYGITETTVHTTYRRLLLEDMEQIRGSLIGVPIPDLGVQILDETMQPVAAGETGEIYVTGPGVARGYLNRPELTAARFVTLNGERAYRSGDLARRTDDNDIEYLGRIDDQVKIRGFRIELGEIAARLGAHSGISDTAVITRGSGEDVRIVAYCVAKAGRPRPAELRRFLFEQVPDYMVPSAFVFVDELPLTVNGKLDRKRLPEAEEEAVPFEEPRTDAERFAARIWCDVLGLERVGRDDSFIALGGESLPAARVLARIQAERGVQVSFKAFMRSATLADMALLIAEAPAGTAQARFAVARNRPLPASAAQRRLWFNWLRNPNDLAYNETLTVRMEEHVNAAALEAALLELGKRHESLRTSFVEMNGNLIQMIHAEPPVSLLTTGDPESFARLPFHLSEGPLWRTLLLPAENGFILYVTIHHIVWDALSEAVFVRELETLYRGERLPAAGMQPADIAAHEQEAAADSALDSQLDYWETKLAGELPVMDLPSFRTRPDNPSTLGAREPLELDAAAAAALKDFARREGATLFQVLLTIFYVVLHRHSGAEDICVGTVTNGRSGPEMDGLVGYFVAPLVLRTQMQSSLSFRELLERVRQTTLDAYNHPDVPIERLIEVLRPARRPGVDPLFQVGFALGPRLTPIGMWSWDHYEVFSGHAKFDLSLQLEDKPDGIRGQIEYKTDVVDSDLVRRMAGHIRVLLDAVLRDPLATVGALPLLTEVELEELHGWNSRRLDWDRTLTAHDLFRAQAERTPDATAAQFGGESLTYGELERRANQVAHRLRAMGAGPDVIVGIFCDRSLEAIVALVAILKAGAAFLPLDPTYPEDRLRFMIEDSGARAIVTQGHLAHRLTSFKGELFVLEQEEANCAAQPSTAPETAVRAEHLAYVIYTSGSTGRPKGVLLEHRNLVGFIHTFGSIAGMREGTRTLQFARLSFDASVLEIGLSLASGAALILAPQTSLLGPRELAAIVRDHRVNYAIFPPAMLALLDPGEVPSLQTVISGGEACSADTVDRWAPGRRFLNAYGPTEITVSSSASVCHAGGGKPSIGRPLPNTEQWVLDAMGQPQPVGVPGELYIGGVGVARGYLNRAELSAERFLKNPFSADPEARLYRTGDLVRWRPDGELDYLGRIDSQVKLRGFRIETGEVQSILRRHPEVTDAVVKLREDIPGDKRLVAYVVLQGAQLLDHEFERRLRSHLAGFLPEYMVPSAFVRLDEMPLSPSGKIDAQRLPAPQNENRSLVKQPGASLGSASVRGVVTAIWCEVLGLSDVPVDAPFFDLGGHSLSLARVQVMLRERLQSEVDMVDLFRYQTVAKLAGFLSQSVATAALPFQPVLTEETRPPAPEVHKGDIAIIGYAVRPDLYPLDASFLEDRGDAVRQLDSVSGSQLECAWSALEDAGYDPRRYRERIGVFIAGEAAALATLLDLRGPAVSAEEGSAGVLTSSHLARLFLLGRECEIALAGGSYAGQTCVLILKKLCDAVEEGDSIRGVIRSSVMGRDAVEAAASAYRRAGISPGTLGLVVAGKRDVPSISLAFRRFTQKREFCPLSMETQETTPIVQALTAFARETIAPATGTAKALPGSAFFSTAEEISWRRERAPRRAAIAASSQGNHVHIVMEEAENREPEASVLHASLICLSARSHDALLAQQQQLESYLQQHPEVSLQNAAYTLHAGRSEFQHRSFLIAETCADLNPTAWTTTSTEPDEPSIQLFLRPSEISEELMVSEPTYRSDVDRGASVLRSVGSDSPHLVASWAMGKLLLHLGVIPRAITADAESMLAAGALAGVFRFKDAAALSACGRDTAGLQACLQQVHLRPPTIALADVTAKQATDPKFWLGACQGSFKASAPNLQAIDLGAIATRRHLLTLLGDLWSAGAKLDLASLYPQGTARRVPLPTYPFKRPVLEALSVVPCDSPGLYAKWDFGRITEAMAHSEEIIFAEDPEVTVDAVPGLRQRLEAYCASRVYDFFVEHGRVQPQIMVRSGELAKRLEVKDETRDLYNFLIGLLSRAGDASILDTRILLRNIAPGRTQKLAAEIACETPGAAEILALIDHAMLQLASALRGHLPGAGPEWSKLWNRTATWRQQATMHRLADKAAETCEENFGIPIARVNLHAVDGNALAEVCANIPAAQGLVLTARTGMETWELLALAVSGDFRAATMSFSQWETAAQEAGPARIAVFPTDKTRRAKINWGVFVLLSTARTGRNESC